MQKQSKWFLVALIASLVSGPLLSMDGSSDEVPFELHGHLIIVKGTIGAVDDLNLIVDTGASVSVISRRLAKKLNLKGASKVITAFGRKQKIKQVTISHLTVGSVTFDQIPAQVGKLSFSGMDRHLRIDGLIGLELMRRTSLTIDYSERKIRFGPVRHSATALPFYGKLPIIPILLKVGNQRLRLLLDTGSGDIILYQSRVAASTRMKPSGEKSRIVFLGGKATLKQVRLQDVSMGNTSWKELPGYLLDVRVGKSDPDGILGVVSLGITRLNLDFQANKVSWER